MTDLRRFEHRNARHDDIVDAEFVEIDDEAPPAPEQRTRQSNDDGRRGWWDKQSFPERATWLIMPLLILGMCSWGGSSPNGAPSSGATSGTTAEDVPASATTSSVRAVDAAAEEPLIDACYHFDSCSKLRILRQSQVAVEGRERLVKASLLLGTIPYTPGDDEPKGSIQWERQRKPYFALCSPARPMLVFPIGSRWIAHTFDFVGGIPGADQDLASIYQALCHGFFSNELEANPRSFGYLANDEGGDEFEIGSPLRLLPSVKGTDGQVAFPDTERRGTNPNMDNIMDAAVGRSTTAQPPQAAGGAE